MTSTADQLNHFYNVSTHSLKCDLLCIQIDKLALQKNGMASRVRNEVEIHCQLKHPGILEVK